MRSISGRHVAMAWLIGAAWMATPGAAQTSAASPPPSPPPSPQRIVLEALEPWQDPALDAVTASTLETFENDAAFRRYLTRLSRIRSERREEWALRTPPLPRLALFQDATQEDVCADPEACPAEEGADAIIVTGARTVQASQSSPVAITNVQTANVDEGDVVKQIGNFLLVLQDGRIFSVDVRGGMRLADRINVYRDADDDDAWYDEMLVEGNRILITAYNYGQDATEISVFKLDTETGRISRDGSFLISSEDYYDSDNYATRIVGDNLIIYTPYEADEFVRRTQRPRIRRWMSQAELDAMEGRGEDPRASGRTLLDAQNIYRPVLRTANPMVHTITICPLGDYRADAAPGCRATAFAAPEAAEMFVSTEAVYLWVGVGWGDRRSYGDTMPTCGAMRPPTALVRPGAVYRVPIRVNGNDSDVGVVGLRGRPFDQFSMDQTRGNFRILVNHDDAACDRADSESPQRSLAYLNINLAEFAPNFRSVALRRHVTVPSPGPGRIENRFADDWLVYGGRDSGYRAIPDPDDADADGDGVDDPVGRPLIVLPVARPREPQTVMLDHNVVRIERVGLSRMVANGYRDASGLSMSLIDLSPQSHVLSSLVLPHRFESEGRSHAFNATVDADGSGILGIPTIFNAQNNHVWWWDQEGSDVSFVTMNPAGRLADAGALLQGLKEPADGYECEVSCIDWYGNSRPIFTGGRIFALMATEIAEGRMDNGRIREIGRLNITVPPAR